MRGMGGQLEQGFNNPFTQLGLQMLAASGQMPGDPSFGQRFAAAGQGFMQQRQQAAELEQQKLLRQIQMGQLAKQLGQQETDAATRKRLQEMVKNNPDILANSPLARAVLESTGDVTGIAELAKVGQPATPKQPYTFEENLPGGEKQQYIWDQATGGYRTTQPYRPTQQQAIDMRGAQFERQQGLREQQAGVKQDQWQAEQALREQQAQTTTTRAQTAASQEARVSAENARKNGLDQAKLGAQFRAADAQLQDKINQVQALIDHPGLAGNFGLRGAIPPIPGSDSANAFTEIERLKAGLGLSELVRLEQQGVKLTPVSNTDLATAEKSAANLDKVQDAGQAVEQLKRVKATLERAREEARGSFDQISSLYQQPAQPQAGAQGGHATPQTQADFDALPAGSLYIDPDDGKLYRK